MIERARHAIFAVWVSGLRWDRGGCYWNRESNPRCPQHHLDGGFLYPSGISGIVYHISVTSNLLVSWHDPLRDTLVTSAPSGIILEIPFSSSPSRAGPIRGKPSKLHSLCEYTTHQAEHSPPPRLLSRASLNSTQQSHRRKNRSLHHPQGALSPQHILERNPRSTVFLRNLELLEDLCGIQLTSTPNENLVK